MKLKARPEGRTHVWLLDASDLAAWLDDWFTAHDEIHAFMNTDDGPVMVGADWGRASFDDLIDDDNALWAVITSDDGTFANHRLVCVQGRRRTVFDIGLITDNEVCGAPA